MVLDGFDADRAAHRLHQRLRQGQSNTRPLDAAVLGIESFEGLEEAIDGTGGDTPSGVDDTFTTFETQLGGRRVIFEPDATVWAEEPRRIGALWKQRLRWERGNVQVTRRYKHVWFRPSSKHRLGSVIFGLTWFTTLLLPVSCWCHRRHS